MKSIIITILTLFSFTVTSQVRVPLEDKMWDSNPTPEKYFVDQDNAMDFFIGTWKFTDGSTVFKIELKKESQVDLGYHYSDLLVGEYQYIEDGIEKSNTLNQIDLRISADHMIWGNSIRRKCVQFPTSQCQDGQLKFFLTLKDPNNDRVSATLVIHQAYIDINDRRDAIIAYIIFKGPPTLNIDLGETFEPPTMPWQKEYRMLRQ
jgi:hypothetical protein